MAQRNNAQIQHDLAPDRFLLAEKGRNVRRGGPQRNKTQAAPDRAKLDAVAFAAARAPVQPAPVLNHERTSDAHAYTGSK